MGFRYCCVGVGYEVVDFGVLGWNMGMRKSDLKFGQYLGGQSIYFSEVEVKVVWEAFLREERVELDFRQIVGFGWQDEERVFGGVQ